MTKLYLFWAPLGIYYDFEPLKQGFQDFRNALYLLVLTDFNILGVFPIHFVSRNLIFNIEYQSSIISGNFQKLSVSLDIVWKGQFWHIGHHMNLILSLSLNFLQKLKKMSCVLYLKFIRILILKKSLPYTESRQPLWTRLRWGNGYLNCLFSLLEPPY